MMNFAAKASVCFRPPDCCLQYNTGLTGRITTFNYAATGDNHLASQRLVGGIMLIFYD